MKLKTRIYLSYFMMILVPVLLIGLLFVAASVTPAEVMGRFSVPFQSAGPELKAAMKALLAVLAAALFLTGAAMSLWISRGVEVPLKKLARATQNIRDGNLDFELQPEGVTEVRELCEDFEEMRLRLKAANEEKVEFDRQNRELISNISHDLRTPITAVKGYVEGIRDGVADTPEKMDRYMTTIYNKTMEMDRLINELSFYSRVSTNRIPYAFSKIRVADFYRDAADELGAELSSKGVSFSYENEAPADACVIADTEQLRRVISNIVGNSVKYMDKPEKRIVLTVRESAGEIVTAIADNGKGIEAKNLGSIFDRFYRTDSSRNSEQGGSGIGLSIVRKVVEDHGGRVWAESTQGEGTVLYFALRRYEEPRAETERTEAEVPAVKKRSVRSRRRREVRHEQNSDH